MIIKPSAASQNDCETISKLAHQGEDLSRLKAKLAAAENLRVTGHEGLSPEESRARLERIFD